MKGLGFRVQGRGLGFGISEQLRFRAWVSPRETLVNPLLLEPRSLDKLARAERKRGQDGVKLLLVEREELRRRVHIVPDAGVGFRLQDLVLLSLAWPPRDFCSYEKTEPMPPTALATLVLVLIPVNAGSR